MLAMIFLCNSYDPIRILCNTNYALCKLHIFFCFKEMNKPLLNLDRNQLTSSLGASMGGIIISLMDAIEASDARLHNEIMTHLHNEIMIQPNESCELLKTQLDDLAAEQKIITAEHANNKKSVDSMFMRLVDMNKELMMIKQILNDAKRESVEADDSMVLAANEELLGRLLNANDKGLSELRTYHKRLIEEKIKNKNATMKKK